MLGGKSFTVPCILSKNGYGTHVPALIDSGANGLVFIDRQFALELAEYLHIPLLQLKKPCLVRGYDGKTESQATQYLRVHLTIDGNRQLDIPMLVLALGSHDLILGREWLSHFDIWLDVRNRRLVWPIDRIGEAGPLMYRELRTTRQNLRAQEPNPIHQADADRRDRALAQLETMPTLQPVKILKREPLKEGDRKAKNDLTRRRGEIKPATIDIAMIGSAGFHRNLKNKSNTLFVTNIYQIDRIIDEKLQAEYDESDDQVEQELPAAFAEFTDVFSKKASDELPPHRPFDHKIQLESDNTLGYSPLYNQSVEELLAVKKYLNENLKKGFIVDSQAPFASPTLFVKKANGSLRFCVDFRKLNALTRKDRYPLPLMDETFARLSRAKVFTKLDIRQAFHRIRMHPDSEDLTTFRTRYGAYKCKVLPFGLTNGPATYQRYMNNVLFNYLDAFCTAYLDDILIYSENELEHELHVKKVLQRLRDAGLQADISKSEFGVKRTKYLGFIISTDGIQVDPDKIEVIRTWEPPMTVKGIQSFLGFCNFYRRFIRDYSRIAKPLSNLVRKDTPFIFDAVCLEAFEELKRRLTSTPILAHYDASCESILETDASNGVVGGVLSQKQSDGLFHPVAYFSKTMAPAECNYEIHDKEMLAIVRTLEHWRAELMGLRTQLPIYSDHKALEYFMTKRQLTARQARWAELLSQYYFRIEYRTGKSNERADALTRRIQDNQDKTMAQNRVQALLQPSQLDPRIRTNLPPVVDLPEGKTELAPVETTEPFPVEANIVDQILAANRGDAPEMIELRSQTADSNDWKLENGLLQYKNRLFVPGTNNLRTHLIHEAHDQVSTAHPGQNKTIRILRSRYYWPKMSDTIRQYIRNCAACQRATVPRDKTPGLLQPLPIPERPWQHISMDFKSFPLDKAGYDMIFVVVDRLSKRSYSIPCHKTTKAKDMARLFIMYIWRTHGPPDTIVSDRGPQFISAFWHEFCRILGIKLKLSTADHPQTDGQTEIMNQYIDQRLRPFVNYYQDNWSELLPIIDYAQATLPHESIGLSPFQVEFGYEPRTSFDWDRPTTDKPLTAREKLSIDEAQAFSQRIKDAWDIARSNMEKAQIQQKKQANRHRREVDFGKGDFVWVSNKPWLTDRPSRKLANQREGPYEILEKVGNSYRIKFPLSVKVHPIIPPNRLRKAAQDPLPGQTVEPPDPIQVEGENEWEVEKVLAVRQRRDKLQYRIQWLGFDEDPDWYPASNIKNAPHKLRDFHTAHPDRPGPPRQLDSWITAWENDEDAGDHPDDDKPV